MSKNCCPISGLGEALVKKLSRSEAKRADIIDAARRVFLSKGFDVASMDLIAKEASVSKRTVYCHFQSKENLFADIMLGMCESKREEIIGGDGLETSDVLSEDRPIQEALTELSERFLLHIFEPESIALIRILIGQADQFPEIGREFFNQGPQVMLNVLEQYFEKAMKEGNMNIVDPARAADIFLSALLGSQHIECLITACPPPTPEEIKQKSERTVDMFLNGCSSDSHETASAAD